MKKYFVAMAIVMIASTGFAKQDPPGPDEPKKTESDKSTAGDQVQHKVLAFNLEGLTEKGEKNWDVTGESAVSVSQTEIKMDKIIAKSYGGQGEATITADKGIYDKTKNNVRLTDNVIAVIENDRGSAADFPDMLSNQQPKAAVTQGDNKQKKTKTVITCDGDVLFDYEKNHAYFNKNVKVITDDGRIDADKITVNLDPATKKVVEIIAEGSVKITKGENTTFSDRATYIEAEKKIILTGQPKLVIYQEGGFTDNFLGKK